MKKTYILTTIVICALAIAGCQKGFLNQSVNPNTPSSATPQQILAGALQSSTGTTGGNQYLTFGIWCGYFAPSGSYVPSTATLTYNFTNTSFNEFTGYYNNLANYNVLITMGAASPALANFEAIAKVMTAYDYEMLVDNYSDVPYSQALNSSKYLFPAYDKGQAIYNDLELQLDAAIGLMSTSATSPGTSDIYFGGNMTNWRKFANFLKLRIAIRQSNITANKAGLVTELAKTISTSADLLDDNTGVYAQPGYANSASNGGQYAPFYAAWGISAAGAYEADYLQDVANSFYISMMVGYNDTLRLKQCYQPTLLTTQPSGTVVPDIVKQIVGNTLGSNSQLSNANTSTVGIGLAQSATMSQPIVLPSEACFLNAEAVLEGYLPAAFPATGTNSAQDYYQRGIVASFKQLLVPNAATAAVTYYSQPIVDVNWTTSAAAPAPTDAIAGAQTNANGTMPAGTALQRAIITQKYISQIGFGFFETYNEYRRTGMPNLLGARSLTAGALGTGAVPNRIFFPSGEFSTNTASVSAEPTINVFTSLIFWARNVNP